MRQFSLRTALLAFIIVGLGIALTVSRHEFQSAQLELQSVMDQLETLKDGSVSNEFFSRRIAEQEIAMSFILKLLDNRERHFDALEFIASIDGGIQFVRKELPLYDGLAVYIFSEPYRTLAKGIRPDYEPKAVCFLVDLNDGSILDELMVDGELSGPVWANLRDTDFEQYIEHADQAGVKVQYAIDRDGFHEIGAEDLARQEIVHAKAWIAILESGSGTPSEIAETRRALKEMQDGVRRKFREDQSDRHPLCRITRRSSRALIGRTTSLRSNK